MTTRITNFGRMVEDGDLVLFFFSNYVCHVNKKYYMIPIDHIKIESDIDIEDFPVDFEQRFKQLVSRGVQLTLILR